MSIKIESANPVVIALVEGTAPRPARVAAARGILPLPQNDLLEVLVNLASANDEELSENARQSLSSQDKIGLGNALQSTDIATSVLAYYAAKHNTEQEFQEFVIVNPKTPPESIVALVTATDRTALLDFVSFNQQLLIKSPGLIDAVIANSNRSSEAERRVMETKREFFEKERGSEQIISELRAQGKPVAADFLAQSDSDIDESDALLIAAMFEEAAGDTDDAWLGLDLIEDVYEETPEQRQAIVDKIMGEFSSDDDFDLPVERVSTLNLILKLGIKDRAKLASKGDREARNILIRDPNRLIAAAVISNPRLSEQEVEKISTMRTISEEILRLIASNRQWARNYAVMHNLARNPRTPIANTMNILTRLQLRDLAALSKNRNVSDAVRRQALRLSQARSGR